MKLWAVGIVVAWSIVAALIGALAVVVVDRTTAGDHACRVAQRGVLVVIGLGSIAVLFVGMVTTFRFPLQPIEITLGVLGFGLLPLVAVGTGWMVSAAFVRDHGMDPGDLLRAAGRAAATTYGKLAIAVVGYFTIYLTLLERTSGLTRTVIPVVALVAAGVGYAIVEPYVYRLKLSTTDAPASVRDTLKRAGSRADRSYDHVRMIETPEESVIEAIVTGVGPTRHVFVTDGLVDRSPSTVETALVSAAVADRTIFQLVESVARPLFYGGFPTLFVEPVGGALAVLGGIGASIVAYRATYRRDAVAADAVGADAHANLIQTAVESTDRPLEWPLYERVLRGHPDPASRIDRLRSTDR